MNPRPPDSATVADRLSQLEDELRTLKRERNNRRKLGLVALGALGCMVTIGTAFAATGACPNAMPFCFAANQPATASEVNHNFAQLKEWLEAKVGAVATPVAINGTATFNAGVTAATVTASARASPMRMKFMTPPSSRLLRRSAFQASLCLGLAASQACRWGS